MRKYSHKSMAVDAVRKLERCLKAGKIPAVYYKKPTFSPVGDLECDWWPDLPWDEKGHRESVQHILSTPKLVAVVKRFDAKFGSKIMKGLKEVEVEV